MSKFKQKKKFLSESGQVTFEFMISIIFVLGVFVYCLTIFQSRSDFNVVSSQKWVAQESAFKLARNINNVNLMDEGSFVTDSLYWLGADKNILVTNNSVQVWYGEVYADAFLSTNKVTLNITDYNGLIVFRKTNGGVVLSYS